MTDVYYVTPEMIDGRNATSPRDHRLWGRPVTPTVVSAAPPAAPAGMTMVTSAGPYQYPVPQGSYYGPANVPVTWPVSSAGWGYPTNPPYWVPPMPPANNLASILGGFGDIGSLANIVAQVVAAFLPLPASPTPQDGTDNDSIAQNTLANSSNLIRYQNALALFARRDQQLLTLGSVLKELFKRPGVVTG